MFATLGKYKKYGDYIPLMLIAILFMAENEIKNHTVQSSCQLVISLLTLLIFFLVAIKFKSGKYYGFITAFLLWVILVYLKNCYFSVNK